MAPRANIEILMAPARTGKTAAALAAYRDILRAGPISQRRRALWLAPTRAAAGDIREALVDHASGALLDPGVTTFAGFAAEVIWDAGLRVRMISTLQRRRLIRRAIAAAAADGALSYFQRVAESSGLVNLVDDAITSLKRRDVPADAFSQDSRHASPRQRELANLYTRYEERLSRGNLLDAEGLFLAARTGLRTAPEVATGLELVVVDGFTDFTSAQLEILKVLAERAKRVLVTLVGDVSPIKAPGSAGGPQRDGDPTSTQSTGKAGGSQLTFPDILIADSGRTTRTDLFAKTLATCDSLARLNGANRQHDAPASLKPQASGFAAWPALSHLERNLFRRYADLESPSSAVKTSLDRIQIAACSGVQAEIEETARRVKQLLVDGAAPADIVVAYRSTHEVADRVRSAFDDFGIPVHLDASRRLAATPLVRSLLGVLRLHAENWPYRGLLQVVGDQSLSSFEADATPAQWPADSPESKSFTGRAAVELCVRHAQLPVGRRELLEQIAAWAADETGLGAVDASVAAAAAPPLHRLAEHLDALPKKATLGEWITAVERIVQSLGVFAGRAETIAVWRTLVNGMRAISQVDGAADVTDKPLAIADLIELVAAVAVELPAPAVHDATGRVRVLSAEAARFVQPRHLFVGGLSEQSFPGNRRIEPAIAEGDAASLADGERPARSDEMLLFYQLVTRPTETLTLSYPALDAKAQPMPPSPFLVELQRCFAGLVQETRQQLRYQSQLEGATLSRGDLRRHAVAQAQTRERGLLAALVRSPRYQQLGQSVLDGIETVASRGDRQKFGVFEGLFASDGVQAILEGKYGPEFLWSPSQLETYAACPFRFFGEYVLGLRELPELALESDLARRGSVLHDTLARLYARLNAAVEEGGSAPPPELVAQQFQETLDEIAHARPRRGLDGALREIERRQIAAWASKFAEQHQDYAAAWQHLDVPLVPRYFEARFGPKHRRSQSANDAELSTDKPLVLSVNQQQYRFTGSIDRIDVGRAGDALVFNVIDYKTSARAQLKQEQIEAGTQIQLPLYAIAVAELLLAEQQAVALSAGYWSVRGKGFGMGARSGGPLAIGEVRDGKVHMAAGWSQLRETLLARIAEIIGGIRRGSFPVFNEDKNCGQICPLSTGCRITHIRSLEKSWPPSENCSSGSLPLAGRAGEGGDAGTRGNTPP